MKGKLTLIELLIVALALFVIVAGLIPYVMFGRAADKEEAAAVKEQPLRDYYLAMKEVDQHWEIPQLLAKLGADDQGTCTYPITVTTKRVGPEGAMLNEFTVRSGESSITVSSTSYRLNGARDRLAIVRWAMKLPRS